MPNRPAGIKGWAAVVKTAGQATPAILTQTNLMPALTADPKNLRNNQYFVGLNASMNPAVVQRGKRTPTVAIRVPLMAAWLTPTFMNSLIALLDAYNCTDEFGIGINDGGSAATRVYDGAKCQMVRIFATSGAASPMMDIEFVCRYGDSEKGVPTSIATPTPVAGQAYGPSQVGWNATATEVDGFDLRLMRPQGLNNFLDQTLYSDIIQSGMSGGTITLFQNPLAATVPSSTVTLQLGTAGTGLAITLLLDLDEKHEPVQVGRGRMANTLFLIDESAGAIPFTFATY